MHTQKRTDFLEFIPAECKRVLSVGCSNGAAETAMIERGMRVVGIEINSQAAKKAQENGLEVLIGDAASVSLQHFDEPFDFLMYADVLEHLADPLTVLLSHLKYVKTGGRILYVYPTSAIIPYSCLCL